MISDWSDESKEYLPMIAEDGSVHELDVIPGINRVTRLGFTEGCKPERFRRETILFKTDSSRVISITVFVDEKFRSELGPESKTSAVIEIINRDPLWFGTYGTRKL